MADPSDRGRRRPPPRLTPASSRDDAPEPRAPAGDLFAHFGVDTRAKPSELSPIVDAEPCPGCSWSMAKPAVAAGDPCPVCGHAISV